MNRKQIFKIQLLSTLFIAVVLIFSVMIYSHQNSDLLLRISCFFIIAELTWILFSWNKLAGGIFNPYGMFISMVALTHGAVPLLTLLSVSPNYQGYTYNWVSSIPVQAVVTGYFLIALSCSLVHIGACYAPNNPLFLSGKHRSSVKIVGWVLIILSIIPFLLTIKIILSSASNIGYLAYFESYNINTWLLNGSLFLPVGAYFLFASQIRLNVSKITSTVLIFAYSLAYLMIGSRNKAILNLVILVWLNQMIGIKIPRWILLSFAIAILIMAPILAVIRMAPDIHLADAWAFFGGISGLNDIIIASLSQLGIYSNIVTTTVATFPNSMDFNWGRSYLNAVYFVIPNFFLPRGEHFGLDLSTVTWLADSYYSELAQKGLGFGTGFSFIAEAYESFGWVGIPFIMPVVGYFVGYLSNSTKSRKPLALAFTASILRPLLFYPRDALYSLSRGIMWYGIVPVALVYLISSFRRKKTRRIAHLSG